MKVKAALCATMLLFGLISCSSYYQIATISSDNASLKDNGEYSYNVGDITVYYDFWSECGSVYFAVENNSAKDISIDLTKSFFVKNGLAYDYFLNRTDSYMVGYSVAKGRSVSTSHSTAGAVTGSAAIAASDNSIAAGVGASISAGVSNSITGAASGYIASMRSHSIEYKEADIVTVPTHSAKAFKKYKVASGEFIQCGLIRNPRGGEHAVVQYSESNSPIVIENRLVVVVDGQEMPIISKFYVSEFNNLPERKVLKKEYPVYCSGQKSQYAQKINLYAQSNRYYVKYTSSRGGETGRTKSSSAKESNSRLIEEAVQGIDPATAATLQKEGDVFSLEAAPTLKENQKIAQSAYDWIINKPYKPTEKDNLVKLYKFCLDNGLTSNGYLDPLDRRYRESKSLDY